MSLGDKVKKMLGLGAKKKSCCSSCDSDAPVFEIPREKYFSDYVRKEDNRPLGKLVFDLYSGLNKRDVTCAVLAVGSSTFPDSHWEDRIHYNKTYEGNLPIDYDDLDLKLLPEKPIEVAELNEVVLNVLKEGGYDAKPYDVTTMGTRILKASPMPTPYKDFAYDLHSITTKLSSGTGVDIILSKDDEIHTASERLAYEREGNHAFSLLYRKGEKE